MSQPKNSGVSSRLVGMIAIWVSGRMRSEVSSTASGKGGGSGAWTIGRLSKTVDPVLLVATCSNISSSPMLSLVSSVRLICGLLK